MNKEETIQYLDDQHIHYEIVEHIPVYTIDEMLAAKVPHPEIIPKNLFLRDDKKRNYYLITAREDRPINLKEFKQLYHTRSLSFASEEDLMKFLHLPKGSVTPLGLLNDESSSVSFYLDESFIGGKIGIHPNQNTATLFMDTQDLIEIIRKHGNPIILF